jgi:hypothetical protein
MRIYFIPGLGVDERLFMNLKLPGYELRYIHWILPDKNESLPAYALRLAEQIDTSQPFILSGVSFGGMCATEIAKVLKPVKVILISSCKTNDELPWNIRCWKYFPLHKLLGDRFYINSALRGKEAFGFKGKEQKKLLRDMLESMPAGYFPRACNCIIEWKNSSYEQNTIHIHGDNDHILPFRNIKNAIRIKGGSHVMVLNSAEEVSRTLLEALHS